MCTRVGAQTLQHEKQGKTLDYRPIILSIKKKKNRKKDKTTFGEFSGSKSRDAF